MVKNLWSTMEGSKPNESRVIKDVRRFWSIGSVQQTLYVGKE